MAQNDAVVVGIDVSKAKVDACIRALKLCLAFPSTPEGRGKLVGWLAQAQGDQGGDGGERRL